jgi:DNA polymerase-1
MAKPQVPLTLLFDGDMILFESCSAVETEINWEDDLWTLHADAAEAKAKIDSKIQALTEKVLRKLKFTGKYEIILCFTDDVNFRKTLLPTYKANRAGKRKPVCYKGVKAWAMEAYRSYLRPSLEADDCLGILSTGKPNCIIISGDKDFKSVPGRFFDYRRDEFYDISEEQANYWHMYQALIGDTADNYAGCPGIGPKTAEKILAEGTDWPNIVKTFEKAKLTEADALLQARVARILRVSDYDMQKKVPILWSPPTTQEV